METQECTLWTVRWWECSYTHTHTLKYINTQPCTEYLQIWGILWTRRLWASLYHTHAHKHAHTHIHMWLKAVPHPLSATQSRVWSWPGWPSSTLTWKWFTTRLWSQRAKWWTTTHGKSVQILIKNQTSAKKKMTLGNDLFFDDFILNLYLYIQYFSSLIFSHPRHKNTPCAKSSSRENRFLKTRQIP